MIHLCWPTLVDVICLKKLEKKTLKRFETILSVFADFHGIFMNGDARYGVRHSFLFSWQIDLVYQSLSIPLGFSSSQV